MFFHLPRRDDSACSLSLCWSGKGMALAKLAGHPLFSWDAHQRWSDIKCMQKYVSNFGMFFFQWMYYCSLTFQPVPVPVWKNRRFRDQEDDFLQLGSDLRQNLIVIAVRFRCCMVSSRLISAQRALWHIYSHLPHMSHQCWFPGKTYLFLSSLSRGWIHHVYHHQ